MSVELNHTIIPAKDKWVSAKFLADILNLEAGPEWGHFVPVETANGVTPQASPHFPRDIKESSGRTAIPEGIVAPA